MTELEGIKQKIELQTLEICGKFTKELDKRSIGGQVFCAMQVLDEVRAVHDKIVDTLSSLSKLSLKGRSPTACHSPATAGEKENANVFVIGEAEDEGGDKITPTA
eukprot:14937144-Ditylum_brightwellii.AAC.1